MFPICDQKSVDNTVLATAAQCLHSIEAPSFLTLPLQQVAGERQCAGRGRDQDSWLPRGFPCHMMSCSNKIREFYFSKAWAQSGHGTAVGGSEWLPCYPFSKKKKIILSSHIKPFLSQLTGFLTFPLLILFPILLVSTAAEWVLNCWLGVNFPPSKKHTERKKKKEQ